MGKKAKISEKPMKEISIAAELETREVANIATPAPDVADPKASAIFSILASAPGSTCSGRYSSKVLV